MPQDQARTRKRGVQASRVKLDKALVAAGLKTQAALADRIADLEQLDSPPKRLVNRIFKEQAVDTRSLERVARALGVEGYTLYKTQDELESEPPVTGPLSTPFEPQVFEPSHQAEPKRRSGTAWMVILAVLVIGSIGIWRFLSLPSPTTATPETESKIQVPGWLKTPLKDQSAAILAFSGDPGWDLHDRIREKLQDHMGIVSPAAQILTQNLGPDEIARRLQVDLVISGRIERIGRYFGIHVYLTQEGNRSHVWADSFLHTNQESYLPGLIQDISNRIIGKNLTAHGELTGKGFPSPEAQEHYLKGRQYLDGVPQELEVRRAADFFHSALRRYPHYAKANAALCELFSRRISITGKLSQLEDAEQECNNALKLDDKSPEILSAWIYLLIKKDRMNRAAQLAERNLAAHPKDTQTLIFLAESKAALYSTTNNEQNKNEAIHFARQATENEPRYWRGPLTLGRVYFAAGKPLLAAEAAQESFKRQSNVLNQGNLAFYLHCLGDNQKAAFHWQQILDVQRTLKDLNNLGIARYNLEQYEEAIALYSEAIQLLEQEDAAQNQFMWANLGEAQFHGGNPEQAIVSFKRAAELAERDLAKNILVNDKRAHLYYYYTVINKLVQDESSQRLHASIREPELDTPLTSSTAYLDLAQAWLIENKLEKAKQAYRMGTRDCPGYGVHPFFAPLRETVR